MEIQVQPHDIVLEEAILGCLLSEKGSFNVVEPYVNNREVWWVEKNWLLYKKIASMKKRGEDVDLITVSSSMSKKESEIMDNYWLSGLATENQVTVYSSKAYAIKLYEKYLLRQAITMTREVQAKAFDNNNDVYNVLSDAHSVIGELIELRPTVGFNMDETMDKAIDQMVSNENSLVRTGYIDIDKMSGGMTRGEITIVGGRPGHGKTTFLINLVSKLIHQGKRVVLFNRELPNTEVAKKLLCLESGQLSYSMIRNGTFGNGEIEELEKTKNTIKMLYTSDRFAMFDKIKDFNQTAIEVKRFKPDVIIDDYIQLIEPDSKIDQRRLQLEKICNDYKWLAKTSDASVILASQLNRHLEIRGGKSIPQLTDLAESGAIEQVAENVLFVHYLWKIDSKKGDINRIDVVSRKCRYGLTGTARLWYNGDKVKMYNDETEFDSAL